MKTKTIPCEEIPGMEYQEGKEVVLREISYGDKSDIQDAILQIDPQNGFKKIQLGKIRLYALVYGIKSAPFFEGENRVKWDIGLHETHVNNRMHIVRNLPDKTGSYLYEQVIEVNGALMGGVGDDIKKQEPSSSGEAETQSQSAGSKKQ